MAPDRARAVAASGGWKKGVLVSVISIQSQVVFGHVGNSSASFPLMLAGIGVAPVPTVILSNNPRYPTLHGRVLDPGFVADLLKGVEERGLMQSASVILSGYVGSAETGAVIADFVRRAKAANPGIAYVCDPVSGDMEPGFYVKEPVRAAIREQLVPLADMITPNHFELEFLAGRPARREADLIAAARSLPPASVIVTGARLETTPEGMLETFAVTGASAWKVTTPKLPARCSGTGDLMTALLLAHRLRGADLPGALGSAISGMMAVLSETVARDAMELELVRTGMGLLEPAVRFEAVRVG